MQEHALQLAQAAVTWLQGGQIGSANLATSITGILVSELRYLPFGEIR